MVIIILNQRSFNKAKSHLHALKELSIPVTLVADEPIHETGVESIVAQLEDYQKTYSAIKNIISQPHYITTVSEQLLPLVSQLEQAFNLNVQVPYPSAKILADKYLFEKHVASLGFSDQTPLSYMPKTLADFDSIPIRGPVLIKPTVGSGANIYFKKKIDQPHFEYIKWPSIQHLRDYLLKNSFMQDILNANKNGLGIPRFSMYLTHFQIQPYYWSDSFSDDFYGVVIQGKHNLFARSSVARMGDDTNIQTSLINGHQQGKNDPYARERAVWHKPLTNDKVQILHNRLIDSVTTSLNISNLLYAGPSWFQTAHNHYVGYDLNPRISGLLSFVAKDCAASMLVEIWRAWLGLDFDSTKIKMDRLALWGACLLKKGIIKNYSPLEKDLHSYIDQETFLRQGARIPRHISLQTKAFPTAIICTGKDPQELIERYHNLNHRIQMNIEYL